MESNGNEIDPLRKARHDMRGRLNAIKLCISVLPTCTTVQDAVEFLDDIEQGADRLTEALDELERLLEQR